MIKNILLIISGAAIGSVVTWKITKTSYEKRAQEDINAMKELYSRKYEEKTKREESEEVAPTEDVKNKADEARNKASVSEYAAKIRECGYTSYATPDTDNTDSTVEEEEREEMDEPYVIAPEEAGDEGYTIVGLTYYADKILADEDDRMIEDVEELVGFESLNHFGEYEDDSVYVRNDRLKIDYEILLDQRKYSEIKKIRPAIY